jgi:hypothetical protein
LDDCRDDLVWFDAIARFHQNLRDKALCASRDIEDGAATDQDASASDLVGDITEKTPEDNQNRENSESRDGQPCGRGGNRHQLV